MKLYAHRGNTEGAKPKLEHSPEYLEKALNEGYGVEIDAWYSPQRNLWSLGHEMPMYPIHREFMEDDRVIVHAKNEGTFRQLLKYKNIHSFYQDRDKVVITSQGYKLYHEDVTGYEFQEDEIYVKLDGNIWHPNAHAMISDHPINCKFVHDSKEEFFKLLILDVDGVMTDGTKEYDSNHAILSKRYCDRDFTAIKRFQSAGIPVVILTGCNFNFGMAANRKIPFYNAKNISSQLDKGVAALRICEDYGCKISEVGYIGDDYYDLSLLNLIKWSYCPADAAEIVKRNVKCILPKRGGEGVVESLYEHVKENLTQRFPYE